MSVLSLSWRTSPPRATPTGLTPHQADPPHTHKADPPQGSPHYILGPPHHPCLALKRDGWLGRSAFTLTEHTCLPYHAVFCQKVATRHENVLAKVGIMARKLDFLPKIHCGSVCCHSHSALQIRIAFAPRNVANFDHRRMAHP